MTRSIVLALALAFLSGVTASPASAAPSHPTETVVLAGGCFWGMEGVFEQLKGVTSVVSGYSGGAAATAHYEMVSTGTTGHAESVEITFDPSSVSFERLLDVYFLVAHDPTELNRQGPDDGSQYRSEIFYTADRQRDAATAYIRRLTEAKTYHDTIVTKIAPLQAFYPAEEYHQHFMARNPNYPYIVYNDAPKVVQLKRRFPELLKRT